MIGESQDFFGTQSDYIAPRTPPPPFCLCLFQPMSCVFVHYNDIDSVDAEVCSCPTLGQNVGVAIRRFYIGLSTEVTCNQQSWECQHLR